MIPLIIEKLEDSSLIVKLKENHEFFARYTGKLKFTCLECSGPPSCVEFYPNYPS